MDVNSLKVLFTSLSGRYAKALFNEGKKANCLEEIFENFSKLDIFLKNNPIVKKFLTNHCINKKQLDIGWIAVGEHLSFCPVFLNFIRQVVFNKRFDIINKIKYIYNISFAKYKNKRNVIVYSAVELLPEQKSEIEKLVAKAFKEKSIIKYKVDDKIIGGLKITSEELLVDASISSQLEQLSRFYKNLKLEVKKYEN